MKESAHVHPKKNNLIIFKTTGLVVLAVILMSAIFISKTNVNEKKSEPPQATVCAQAPSTVAPETYEVEAKSVSADTQLLSLDAVNAQYSEYGQLTVAGMKPADYEKALAQEWEVLDTPGRPKAYCINLSDLMTYDDIETYIINMDKYDGVQVSVIGKSAQNRNIYMVKINLAPEKDKPVIMISGGVHAREFAGPEYTVKFLNDTLQKAQHDAYTRKLLESAVIVAVPLVNPDGREMIISGGNKNQKSNANGVDLNRNLPSVNAGQLGAGMRQTKNFSDETGLYYFAGAGLGTESETQAMMKWFHYYVPHASLYIDLHQQGGITFYNKRFVSSQSDAKSMAFAKKTNLLLKRGYPLRTEIKTYGLHGDGGTMTDYARCVAEGFIYSSSLGRLVLDAGGEEMPLIRFKDLDDYMPYYKPLNEKFISICIEIGRTTRHLGASKRALENRKREYIRYGWESFLTGTIENILGEAKVSAILYESQTGMS